MNINYDTSTIALRPEPPVPRLRRLLLTPLPEKGHYLFVVDNSAAEKFVCPTLAAYYLFYGREGHARNAALTFGGAIHVGLEQIETHGDKEDESATAQEVLKFFTENPAPPDEYRTPVCALEVLSHYRVRRKFPDFQWNLLTDDAGLVLERPFELPLGVLEVNADIQLPQWPEPQHVSHIHVAWSGKIDAVPFCNEQNRVCDNKTTSRGDDAFVQDFRLSSQSRGYVWAAQQLWPDFNITGFCLNAIYLKKPAAGVGLMDRGPRGGEPALKFFRSYFDYEQASIDSWAENALVRIEDFIHSMVRNYFPMETTYCFNRKYGKCDMWDLCTISELDVRMNMLKSDMFKDVTWDPTK